MSTKCRRHRTQYSATAASQRAPPEDRAAGGEGPDDEYLEGGGQHGRIRHAPAPAGPHDCRYLSVIENSLSRHRNRRSARPARPARNHPRPAQAHQRESIVPSRRRLGPAAHLGPTKSRSPLDPFFIPYSLALPCDAPRSAGGWPQARPEAPEWTGDAPHHREFRRPWAGDLSQWAMPGGRCCVEMRRRI